MTRDVLLAVWQLIDEIEGCSEYKFSTHIDYMDEKITTRLVLKDKENNLTYTETLTEKAILEIDSDFNKGFVARARAFFKKETM